MGLTTIRTMALFGVALCLLAAFTLPALADDNPLTIRVVLSDAGEKQQLGGELDWYAEGKQLTRTTGVAAVKLAGDAVSLDADGRRFTAQRLRAVPTSGTFRHSGKDYRGCVELFPGQQGGLVVLNVLPLEDYLLGVVAAEMPPSWDPEALKAQAVAARTFALARMAARQHLTYDVYATVNDQAYAGLAGEDERTTSAVRATAGQVLTYQGKPITAFFCSDAGGYTKQGTEPYLQPVPCANSASPFAEWIINLNPTQVEQLITGASGRTGQITALTAENDPVSGHLLAITFSGTQGECRITGPKLRKLLGLDVMRSTYARVEPPGSTTGTTQPPAKRTQPVTPAASDVLLDPPSQIGTPGSHAMQEYERPWVLSESGYAATKMRGMWCYNGESVVRCNHEVYVTTADSAACSMPVSPTATAQPSLPAPEPLQHSYSNPSGFNGIVIRGSGYGHSLGMSQWGARGLADQGWDYRRILAYFYSGTKLVQWHGDLPPTAVLTEEQAGFYAPFTPVN